MTENEYRLISNLTKLRLGREAVGGAFFTQGHPLYERHRRVMREIIAMQEALEAQVECEESE